MPHDANGAESPSSSSVVHIDNGSSAPNSSTLHDAPSSTSTQTNTSAAAPTNLTPATASGERDGGGDIHLELGDDNRGPPVPVPIGMIEAQLDEAEAEAISLDHYASAMLAASLDATNNKSPSRRNVETINDSVGPIAFDSTQFQDAKGAASSNLSETLASLPQPQPIHLEPPRPFNLADFDEGEDDKLKSNQVSASNDTGSIIEPTEEDIADGAVLDRATTRDTRRIGNNHIRSVDLEQEDEETQQLETEGANVYATGTEPNNAAAGLFDSELPVLEAYAVDDESEQEVFIATHVEPSLPWWKQRRTKFLLGMVFVVVTALAIALGVSLTGDSSVIVVVEQTDAPSVSHVPTLFPSVSLRPSSHPSLPPTTTPSLSPTFTRLTSSKLVPEDSVEYNWFGHSVDVFGDTLAASAYRDNDKGEDSGSVYIYSRDPETSGWILQQKIVPDDGTTYDYFGWSVAIFDNTLVVGAYGDDDKGDYSGSVYIYSREPTTNEWTLQQKLVADDGAAKDEFGKRVAIHNNTVVVGAPNSDDTTEQEYDIGSAYIFHHDPEDNEWILQQKIVPDDGAGSEYFGDSIAIYNDTLIVGAWGDQDMGYSSGSAYIYNRDPVTKDWILQQKIVPDDGSSYFNFGWSVTIYENVVAVGAPVDSNIGSAYVYQRDQTKLWSLQQKIVSHDGAAIDSFGESVAIYNSTIVVGANWDDDKGYASGSTYIYHQDADTNAWILQEKLVPVDGAADDEFGYSVAIYNGTVVVGSYQDDTEKGSKSGSIYVYS